MLLFSSFRQISGFFDSFGSFLGRSCKIGRAFSMFLSAIDGSLERERL